VDENYYEFEIIRWIDNKPHSDQWATPALTLGQAWARLISSIADSPNGELANIVALSLVHATDVNGVGLLVKNTPI